MKREELKGLGIADELIDKVMALHGATLTAATSEGKRAQEQLAQLTADLEVARKNTGDVAALREQLEKSEKAMQGLKKAQAVRDALGAYKPKDADLLMKLIDVDKVSLTDAGIAGLKEQVEPIKAEKGFLFTDERGGGEPSPPGAKTRTMNDILRGL